MTFRSARFEDCYVPTDPPHTLSEPIRSAASGSLLVSVYARWNGKQPDTHAYVGHLAGRVGEERWPPSRLATVHSLGTDRGRNR